ncbi:hypothetical protein Pmani_014958 [Petrolisthes manimaculis]|uniref:Ig-like domain-containing protein n=1 Tax=Petrolisthes manimaculis TaxID=1843537 RepID=A0AAE1UCG9_9EUCA|nr:hypothetical protein Pmani_014958 [Petrolisthes manimaculis]
MVDPLSVISPSGPHFLPSGDGNVLATVGHTAYLLCRVGSLGDMEKVSWIRKRDLHVLSSGLVVFASDQRFQVIHPQKSDNWTLQIKFSQVRDAGVYECQVNTEPKMHLSYNLSVVESRASVVGPEYVKAGSTINLTCTITPPQPLGLVYWYHNQDMLEYEDRVAITTVEESTGLRSELTIVQATPSHSGNYTC